MYLIDILVIWPEEGLDRFRIGAKQAGVIDGSLYKGYRLYVYISIIKSGCCC